ncbi:hypothetical protein MAQ5080_02694 [Marinomonas aquimarina]|uniref:Apea-like HEPN domain-containing protein n=2 Tax=Marinomonas aquimarina TaxID=295068 RepID=A0A1A8TLW6_9GAMM|nr:hypothetical protein MAQ5080_02694 [Marinomonas aquimarina]
MQEMEMTLETEDQNKVFLNYLDSYIDPFVRGSFASAHSENGHFINRTNLTLDIDGELSRVGFEVVYSIETGLMTSIKFDCKERPSVEGKIQALIYQAYQGVISNKKEVFYKRYLYRYVGGRLNGAYSKGRTLLIAPYWPDQDNVTTDIERFFSVDVKVEAVDHEDANVKGNILADKLAAKLSFWLNLGIEGLSIEHIWGVSHKSGAPEGVLFQRCVPPEAPRIPKEMPSKKEFKAGEVSDFQAQGIHNIMGDVYLPRCWKNLLSALEKSGDEINQAYDSCCFMYQMGLNAGRYHPTVQASYMVAAIESLALSEKEPSLRHFSNFMRFYCDLTENHKNENEVLKFLYEDVRSKHFHSGRFTAGEHEYSRNSHISFQNVKSRMLRKKLDIGRYLVRIAIYNWGMDLIGKVNTPTERGSSK